MTKTEELEPVLRDSIDTAILSGFLLVQTDYGVLWDRNQHRWVWDPETCRSRCCCVIGAYLLATQPSLDPSTHNGDPYDAACAGLQTDKAWLHDFMNGFDGYNQQDPTTRFNPDAYEAGYRLQQLYRPLRLDILALQLERGIKIPPLFEEEEDIPELATTG